MWKKRTNAVGLEYSPNSVYWTIVQKLFSGKYVVEYSMPNCTIFCIAEQLENGRPMPVLRDLNANQWHTVVNTAEGWTAFPYKNGMTLLAGDIVEWGCNHVATIEDDGVNPLVSASWWTNYDGTSKGARYNNPICKNQQEVSNYFIKNYPYRFYHSTTFEDECKRGGGNAKPTYVFRYIAPQPVEKDITKNQIYSNVKGLNIRKEPNTTSTIIGTLPNGYFDVQEVIKKSDYTWFNLGDCYVAQVNGVEYYEAKKETYEELYYDTLAKLTVAEDKLNKIKEIID